MNISNPEHLRAEAAEREAERDLALRVISIGSRALMKEASPEAGKLPKDRGDDQSGAQATCGKCNGIVVALLIGRQCYRPGQKGGASAARCRRAPSGSGDRRPSRHRYARLRPFAYRRLRRSAAIAPR